MYAGFMPIGRNHNNDGSLFFWMVSKDKEAEKEESLKPDKLIFWLVLTFTVA
jgi:hypothetical protein